VSPAGPHLERFEHGGGVLVDEVAGTPGASHVVFLHGWGGNRESLRGVAALFEHDAVVHLLDLPGFGEAPPPPADWGTSNYADLVQQYLADRVAGPVILVGHSFGGRVSVRLAARRIPSVRAIVLMGAPGLRRDGWSRAGARRWGIRRLRAFLTACRPILGQGPLDWHTRRYGSKDYLAAGPLRPLLVRTVTEDLADCARAVSCPVLLLWGADDTEAPVWQAQQYRALMGAHATLEVLPHRDHHFHTGSGAHLCAFKIRAWLAAAGTR